MRGILKSGRLAPSSDQTEVSEGLLVGDDKIEGIKWGLITLYLARGPLKKREDINANNLLTSRVWTTGHLPLYSQLQTIFTAVRPLCSRPQLDHFRPVRFRRGLIRPQRQTTTAAAAQLQHFYFYSRFHSHLTLNYLPKPTSLNKLALTALNSSETQGNSPVPLNNRSTTSR